MKPRNGESERRDVTLEELLTGEFSRTSLKRFGWSWLRTELAEGKAGVDQVRSDLVRAEQWKKCVLEALSPDEGERPRLAERWAGVIKLRIEALEKWSQLVSAAVAYTAGGCALAAVIGDQRPAVRVTFVVLGLCIGLVGGLYRYYIDRHKGSNKFVLACLEAAQKT